MYDNKMYQGQVYSLIIGLFLDHSSYESNVIV